MYTIQTQEIKTMYICNTYTECPKKNDNCYLVLYVLKTRLRQVCNDVPRIQCTEIPLQDCKQVPREECTSRFQYRNVILLLISSTVLYSVM